MLDGQEREEASLAFPFANRALFQVLQHLKVEWQRQVSTRCAVAGRGKLQHCSKLEDGVASLEALGGASGCPFAVDTC